MTITFTYGNFNNSFKPRKRGPFPTPQRVRDDRKARVRNVIARCGDVTVAQIARHLAVTQASIWNGFYRGRISEKRMRLIEQLTAADFPHGRENPIDRKIERDRDMIALIEAGETLKQVGDRFGISRERVRQIVTMRHGIATRTTKQAVQHRIERQQEAEAKKAKKAERLERIATVKRLVENEGWSIAKAMASVGFTLSQAGEFRGVKSQHGRWRPELAERRARMIEMAKAGHTVREISAELGMKHANVSSSLHYFGVAASRRPYKERVAKPPRIKAARPEPKPREPRRPIAMPDTYDEVWGQQELHILVAGWNAGKSGSAIAGDLGEPFTRNSVLGKVFRIRRGELARR